MLKRLIDERGLQLIFVVSREEDIPEFITHVVPVSDKVVGRKIEKNLLKMLLKNIMLATKSMFMLLMLMLQNRKLDSLLKNINKKFKEMKFHNICQHQIVMMMKHIHLLVIYLKTKTNF